MKKKAAVLVLRRRTARPEPTTAVLTRKRRPVLFKDGTAFVTMFHPGGMKDAPTATKLQKAHDAAGLVALGSKWYDWNRNEWREDWPAWMWAWEAK